jgi:hypothetical protein
MNYSLNTNVVSRRCGQFVLTSAVAVVFCVMPPLALAYQDKTSPAEGKATTATSSPTTNKDQAAKPKPTFTVRVSKGLPKGISLHSEKTPMPEVAAEISNRLKVPVMMSPSVRSQTVTIDFDGLTVEPAMKLLAPQVYIDYELSGDAGSQPKPLAIYLYAYNETPPALNATVKGNSETIMIEGNTEDGVDSPDVTQASKDGKPLEIKYERQMVSIQSKKQPLTAVLAQLANAIGVPFELRYDSTEVVDTGFSNYRLEDAIRQLSPNVRLYFRTDLQRVESVPLRIVLVAPAARS